jgi:hypothetical protein
MLGWIVFGSGGDSLHLGTVEHRHCETCERERPFSLHLRYRYGHIYWVFAWVTMREYLMICDVCSRGWALDAKQIQETLKEDPIPFMRRLGWTLPVGLIASCVVMGVIGSAIAAISR